jgi:hypothetical protein
MALNVSLQSSGAGGQYLNFIKYNASAGRMFRRDKENGEVREVDITRNFKAVMDLENVESGYGLFAPGAAPDLRVTHWSKPAPANPGKPFKPAARVVMKLSKECGGDIREMSGNAQTYMQGIEKLHNDWLAQSKDNPGKLPVVVLRDTIGVTTGESGMKKTNFIPDFEIVGWVKRPDDLVYKPHSSAAPVESDDEEPAPARTPPSTGSTKAKAPVMADEEDFG